MPYAAVISLIILALLLVSVSRTLKLTSHAQFMVADRKLSAAVLVFTLLCSWIGAGSLFGGAEFAVRRGISSLWLPAGGWAGLIVVYFTAGRARAFAQYTVPDLLETRYSALARIFGTACIIVSYTAIVSYQFRGGGRILNLAFGVSQRAGTLIVAGFVILFTALAGMSSVAYTDLVIGLVVTLGCVVALPALVMRAGGWGAVRTALPASHVTALGGMGRFEALGYFLPTFMLMIGNQTMYQKFFSAKSERDARLSVVGWIAGTILLETMIVLLAMVGGVIFGPEIRSGILPAWGIVPYAARRGVVPFIGALFLGGILAKVISTGNNYLFSPASSVVHDVFQRFLIKGAGDRALVSLSRVTVVLLGLIALAQSFQPSILATAVYAYDVYGAGITPAVVAAFFWKRATTAGGLSSILAGTVVAVVWRVAHVEETTRAGLGYTVPMVFPALAASVICLVAVSLLTPLPREEQWRPFFRGQEVASGRGSAERREPPKFQSSVRSED